MSRIENLDTELKRQEAEAQAMRSAEGGMTEDDLYMRGGKMAELFCIGFAFIAPVLMFWRVVF